MIMLLFSANKCGKEVFLCGERVRWDWEQHSMKAYLVPDSRFLADCLILLILLTFGQIRRYPFLTDKEVDSQRN